MSDFFRFIVQFECYCFAVFEITRLFTQPGIQQHFVSPMRTGRKSLDPAQSIWRLHLLPKELALDTRTRERANVCGTLGSGV